MRSFRHGRRGLLLAMLLIGCSSTTPRATAPGATVPPTGGPAPQATTAATPAATAAPIASAVPGAWQVPAPRTLLVDTDVAGDDLVALAFLLSARNVTVAGITVSGTGEAHCEGGVDIVLRLLDRLRAPDIPVACGRETPLAGDHEFPGEWRERVDAGSGLRLPATTRKPSSSAAVELITDLSKQHERLHVLTLGPVTNLADALLADATLAARLGPVTIMGGALHVPGNLVCCGAPPDNHVAEWNIYVDPHGARVVVDSGIVPSFVSLDGTNQVPILPGFATKAMHQPLSPARTILADLFTANPFMTDGSFYLWDALAAELAAGYGVGAFSPARIAVEEAEGTESGFTRPVDGEPNIRYASDVDAAAALAILLDVLGGGTGIETALGWPSTFRNVAGSYAWGGNRCAGPSCAYGFMHNGFGSGDVRIRIDTTSATSTFGGVTTATIAGHAGTYRPDSPGEQWMVEIDGVLVSIRLTARPGTSAADLAEAHAIVESMRYAPGNRGVGFLLVFELATDDWDSG